ncbi:MAG TPA: (deoxy)nucleoside triphosphate pyrophosphohydrolase [Vicinamibacterales bacterium]|nr:(deoxy)nucleoside triphosphate pyrophosphohydrolase [Vicinamibacterales bacterium]
MTDPDGRPTIIVVAAVVERDGRFLVTRRPDGTHLEGCWEFPGGKCEPGESHADCLAREMREELGVDIAMGDRVLEVTHSYDDRIVELHFYRCRLLGDPSPQLGQQLRWVTREELGSLPFPPADEELIALLTGESYPG